MRRRLFCLLPLALLAACEEQPAAVQPEVTDSERVYSPGPIAWEQLSDEHRRRARMMLARHQEAVPEDEDALRTRWNAMSPAQQRFAIRAPRRMAPPRNVPHRTTTRSGSRGSTTTHVSTSRSGTRSSAAPARSGSSSSSSRGSSSSSTSRSGSSQRLPTPPPRNQR